MSWVKEPMITCTCPFYSHRSRDLAHVGMRDITCDITMLCRESSKMTLEIWCASIRMHSGCVTTGFYLKTREKRSKLARASRQTHILDKSGRHHCSYQYQLSSGTFKDIGVNTVAFRQNLTKIFFPSSQVWSPAFANVLRERTTFMYEWI